MWAACSEACVVAERKKYICDYVKHIINIIKVSKVIALVQCNFVWILFFTSKKIQETIEKLLIFVRRIQTACFKVKWTIKNKSHASSKWH